ncbi:DUF1822 family protein [Geitlerinema sp. PCC 9228]|uniref:DUF1822 family protein n=1 Tax=Geitlerinema sp. PCC 9228 TaxID=111611 RepID=UPI0008F9E1E2|nr:DUF1822 family protein [Geitlerinema sp. PCC 9228]
MVQSPSFFDWESLDTNAFAIEPNRASQAVEMTSEMGYESQQWQMYLQFLALGGLQQWLQQRSLAVPVEAKFQKKYAPATNAVGYLQAGGWKILPVAMGSLTDDAIAMPRVSLHLPTFAHHFYVAVEVAEEAEQARILGVLRYDKLRERCRHESLSPEEDWHDFVPLSWFESPDRLLLYLRCLEGEALPLPGASAMAAWEQLEELTPIVSQLQSSDRPWWEMVAYERVKSILANPELLELATADQPYQHHRLLERLREICQPAINVAKWLQDEIQTTASELSWVLLPSLTPATSALRSVTADLDAILLQLERNGLEISETARGAYRNMQLGGISLKLYAIASADLPHMPATDTESSHEAIAPSDQWSLLFILSTNAGVTLPVGTTLRISDETDLLLEKKVNPGDRETILYACVVGERWESFSVAIALDDRDAIALPPFIFCPDEEGIS